MIKREVEISYDKNLEKEVQEMNDKELKDFIENDEEFKNYYLEYLELARREYLKRGFKNIIAYDSFIEDQKKTHEKYPFLKTLSGIFKFSAWLFAVVTIYIAYKLNTELSKTFENDILMMYTITALIIGAFFFIILYAESELIKVFLGIEKNTRRNNK